jgi:nitroreductase
MDLDKSIQTRHSVRKFSNKKPDWRNIIECMDAMRYAPMAGNNFTLKFILIDDEEKIRKIAEAAQQQFIAETKFVVVVCSDMSRTKNLYKENAEKWTRQQAGAAIQNFLLKIEEFKLSTCWIGHFVEGMIKKELKIPENIDVEAIFPIGYEFQKSKTRNAKIDLDRILYFNSYGNSKMKSPKG